MSSKPDDMLSEAERELIDIVQIVGQALQDNREVWTEDLIPPTSDDDVLTSQLYTEPGHPDPAAGFRLWHGDTSYFLRIERDPHPVTYGKEER